MCGQAKIVVGREIDDAFAVERAHRGLLVFEHAQTKICALLFELVELFGEVAELRTGGFECHKFLQSHSPRRHGGAEKKIKRSNRCRSAQSVTVFPRG